MKWLSRKGLRLIERNFNTRQGEIDLIMEERSWLNRSTLVFIEVRYRQQANYGGAAGSITPAKQQRIIRAAHLFIQQGTRKSVPWVNWPARFDVLAISGSLTKPHIAWLRHAFEC